MKWKTEASIRCAVFGFDTDQLYDKVDAVTKNLGKKSFELMQLSRVPQINFKISIHLKVQIDLRLLWFYNENMKYFTK